MLSLAKSSTASHEVTDLDCGAASDSSKDVESGVQLVTISGLDNNTRRCQEMHHTEDVELRFKLIVIGGVCNVCHRNVK